MVRSSRWLLPLLLAAVQSALWSAEARATEPAAGATAWLTALTATALSVLALGQRRRAPLVALAGTLTVSVPTQLLLPPDTLTLVTVVAVLVALFSVTALSDWVRGLGATAVACAVQFLPSVARYGFGGTLLPDWFVTVGLCSVAAALGAGHRHRRGERRLSALRLVRAERQKERAADAERDRLAHELHDISAHHLTSVVVSVEAARRLGGSRPDLVADALTFASRTAHETRSALGRLVTVMRADDAPAVRPMTASIEELVAGFGKVGRPITVSLPPDLAGPAAEAAHGIVREALTNALRYAPGARVAVRAERAGGALLLSVDNGRAPGAAGDRLDIGSGRGVAGMRRRATELGGQLTAGPRPDGGWRVHAVLPEPSSARGTHTGRRRNFTREQRMADVAVFGFVTMVSVGASLEAADRAGFGAPVRLLLALLLTVHALPLLGRRRAPWAVLAATCATPLLWPAALGSGALPPAAASALVWGGCAQAAAVYAVAAYGRVLRPPSHAGPPAAGTVCPPRPRLTFLAVPAAVLSFALAVMTSFSADGKLLGDPVDPFTVAFLLVPLLCVLAAGLTVVWLAGWLMHRRRRRELDRREAALSALLWSTKGLVHDERRRVADGLRETVLRETDGMISAAAAGSLDDVATATRAALAAMRGLLGSLDAGKAPQRRHRASAASGSAPL
ncbi:histidine kinase [Streptomyces sp. PAL114]|uniref:ATP-binding protein n=1 Tax=Streptomyces sp. PAL114 TaxID=2970893 RepID=UPI0028FD3F34|nr:histidine kinase [Streptomyces sp. PAL114]MDU0299098.1 histidine kinase [Streptomyces sp. PAL114]